MEIYAFSSVSHRRHRRPADAASYLDRNIGHKDNQTSQAGHLDARINMCYTRCNSITLGAEPSAIRDARKEARFTMMPQLYSDVGLYLNDYRMDIQVEQGQ